MNLLLNEGLKAEGLFELVEDDAAVHKVLSGYWKKIVRTVELVIISHFGSQHHW